MLGDDAVDEVLGGAAVEAASDRCDEPVGSCSVAVPGEASDASGRCSASKVTSSLPLHGDAAAADEALGGAAVEDASACCGELLGNCSVAAAGDASDSAGG